MTTSLPHTGFLKNIVALTSMNADQDVEVTSRSVNHLGFHKSSYPLDCRHGDPHTLQVTIQNFIPSYEDQYGGDMRKRRMPGLESKSLLESRDML